MTISISPLMHNTIADSIYNNILSKSSKYYYFLGKTVPYTTIQGVEQVETPLPTYKYELSTRREIISFKEITSSDVSFVIPRIDWELGTVYDHYDDNYSTSSPSYSGAASINEAKFYVLTTEFNLYICLDNNLNTESTIAPSGYDSSPFVTSDGYKWKFMLNIPPALRIKFLTSQYIPITTAINNIFYNNGAIDTFTIDNPGTGYPANTTASITITSASASVSSLVIGRKYAIASLGTTSNTQWNTIAGTTGVTYSVGSIFTSAVTSGSGTGTITGTGADLRPRVSTVDGQIVRVDIVSGGSGYLPGATLTVVGSGTGKYSSNTTALLTAVIIDGAVDFVCIVDPGKDYNANNTTLTVQSDTGVDAHLTAIVEGGQIIDIIIDNPGYGYKTATVTASGLGGSGAKFTVNTSGGKLDSIQANVELLAVNGSIDYIHVENEGSGYQNLSITITGDGEGATATPVVQNGKLKSIIITNRGKDYTYASINITAIGLLPIDVAYARAIISPRYGHGKNAINQLFSNSLLFYSTISNTNSSGFTFNNDYRQFGIIKNPTIFNSKILFGEILGTACYVITGTVFGGTIIEDMILTDTSGNRFVVISIATIGSERKVLLHPVDNAAPAVGKSLYADLITITISTVINPDIDRYSGDMMYIDNRAAFFQTEDQTVTLQTLLKF